MWAVFKWMLWNTYQRDEYSLTYLMDIPLDPHSSTPVFAVQKANRFSSVTHLGLHQSLIHTYIPFISFDLSSKITKLKILIFDQTTQADLQIGFKQVLRYIFQVQKSISLWSRRRVRVRHLMVGKHRHPWTLTISKDLQMGCRPLRWKWARLGWPQVESVRKYRWQQIPQVICVVKNIIKIWLPWDLTINPLRWISEI